jgi:hypothetical protein
MSCFSFTPTRISKPEVGASVGLTRQAELVEMKWSGRQLHQLPELVVRVLAIHHPDHHVC